MTDLVVEFLTWRCKNIQNSGGKASEIYVLVVMFMVAIFCLEIRSKEPAEPEGEMRVF